MKGEPLLQAGQRVVGPISGGGEQSQVEASYCRWRGESQECGRDLRWRGAIAGGGQRSEVQRSDRRWRRAITGGEECAWEGGIAGGGKRSQVVESKSEVEGNDRR